MVMVRLTSQPGFRTGFLIGVMAWYTEGSGFGFEGGPGREVRVHRSISGCARCGCLSLSRDGNKQDLAGFASCCVEVPFGFGLARFHHVCFGLFSLPGIEEALRWKRW